MDFITKEIFINAMWENIKYFPETTVINAFNLAWFHRGGRGLKIPIQYKSVYSRVVVEAFKKAGVRMVKSSRVVGRGVGTYAKVNHTNPEEVYKTYLKVKKGCVLPDSIKKIIDEETEGLEAVDHFFWYCNAINNKNEMHKFLTVREDFIVEKNRKHFSIVAKKIKTRLETETKE